ncbi:M6 family metalloprotease domain-containing protein [Streptomyces sp. RB6PN25]|uniref:M6 family metalloprotease domain-containing protein n=1 Tax=Streptomyces humicola TaxID=2953240 RepID=A0ABT1Q4H7_9ACTN|nr:M6 family metalloprotease domain-containing protein [Streptomyces humicola]MCQ4084831.1 M6 family metalloprotease domain-containing protein [Streptomyces humicola]
MSFPVSAGRRLHTAPLLVLSALLALFALVIVPANPAHAYNGSTSACSLTGTTGYTDEGQQNNIASDPNRFQVPFGPTGTATSKTIRVGMLYVDFPDAVGTGNLADYYNQLSPAANWMWNASYGHTWLNIRAPLNQWLHMPSNSTSYGWPGTPPYASQQQYVLDATTAAAIAGVDLSQYDMFYIVPTKNATAINNSPTYIWNSGNPGVVVNGTTVKWAVTFGQDIWGPWGYHIADHETGHTFGLPDLYSFTGDTHQYVGGWDIMGNIGGPGNQYFGWQSWKLGWTNDSEVSCMTTPGTSLRTPLNPVEYAPVSGRWRIVVLKTGSTSAYVVESRRSALNDPSLCSTGVLIYKVDWSVTTGNGPIQVVANPNAAAPPSGCSALDMDTWQPGQTFTDSSTNVTISVVSGLSDSNGDTVDTSM